MQDNFHQCSNSFPTLLATTTMNYPGLNLKGLEKKFGLKDGSTTGVGNYFRPRATLGFYLCLAGQIQVKYAFSKLKMKSSRAGCGPRAVCCPLLIYNLDYYPLLSGLLLFRFLLPILPILTFKCQNLHVS